MKVIITKICSNLGKLISSILHRKFEVAGFDTRAGTELPADVKVFAMDIRRKKTRDIFRKLNGDAVIHIPDNSDVSLEVFSALLQLISDYHIQRLILVSNASVYGARPDNPQFITEDHPILGGSRLSSSRNLVEIDMLAQASFLNNPSCNLTILRPVNIVGYINSPIMNFFKMKKPYTALGFDPMFQLTHARDLAEAISVSLESNAKGIFNIAGNGQIPLSKILKNLGIKSVPIPSPLISTASKTMEFLGTRNSFPLPVDFLMYNCMVDTSKAKQILNFEPRFNISECIETVREIILWNFR